MRVVFCYMLLLVVLLSGCANTETPFSAAVSPSAAAGEPAVSSAPPVESVKVDNTIILWRSQEIQPLLSPNFNDPDRETVSRGVNDFAFKLSAALSKNTWGDKNFLCSPFSVWLPLAALLNAAQDEYRPALLDALNASGVSAENLNRATSQLLCNLTNNEGYDNPLKIANAIFLDSGLTLKKSFAQIFADYYRGVIFNVDFSKNSAVDAVNRWSSDNTEGLIEEIVNEFEPAAIVAIANAIYFSDRWQWELTRTIPKRMYFTRL